MGIERNKVKPKNNIFMTQAWTKDLEKSQSNISKSTIISKYLKLYCQYSSLNSLKYLADTQRPWFERILWVIIHFVIITVLVFMVYFSGKEFVTTPLITSVETDSYKTTILNFPAIAICSINRISRQSATALADNIYGIVIEDRVVFSITDHSGIPIDQRIQLTRHNRYDIYAKFNRPFNAPEDLLLFLRRPESPGTPIIINSVSRIFFERNENGPMRGAESVVTAHLIGFNASITNRTLDEIRELLVQLGSFYASTFEVDIKHGLELHRLLKIYYNGSYDVTKIMRELTPSCSAMLLKCKLHGTFRNCSNLFDFRKTQDGYCCTFNYARESDDIPVMKETLEEFYIHKVMDLGIERGLTVVMNPQLDDYFYPIMPMMGWKVILFNPTDFPDMTSGGVTEVLAMPLSETFVDVTTTAFTSTPIIKNFPIQKRNCIFPDEESPMYSSAMYTYSDCIVDCKIYHIQRVCGCRPFFYPRRGPADYEHRVCNSRDLRCLSNYKIKWLTIFPHEEKENIFQSEKNALHCENCYPACDDLSYNVLSWKSYMTVGEYNTNLLWNYNVTDEGIIHVYFSKYGTIKLKQDVSFYWYELMSDIGGICGVFIGFSFISVVELLYFLAIVLRDLLCKKSSFLQEDDNHTDENPSAQAQTIRAIYWKELQPRSWHSAKYGKFSTNRARY